MTNPGLEKMASEYARTTEAKYRTVPPMALFGPLEDAYLAGAQRMESRVRELTEENRRLKEEIAVCYRSIAIKNRALQRPCPKCGRQQSVVKAMRCSMEDIDSLRKRLAHALWALRAIRNWTGNITMKKPVYRVAYWTLKADRKAREGK